MKTLRGARTLACRVHTRVNAWVRPLRVFARVYLMGLQPIQWNENFRPAGGADPVVRAGPHGPASPSIDKFEPTWASAADQGVRPTLRFVHPGPSVFDGANTARKSACVTSVLSGLIPRGRWLYPSGSASCRSRLSFRLFLPDAAALRNPDSCRVARDQPTALRLSRHKPISRS